MVMGRGGLRGGGAQGDVPPKQILFELIKKALHLLRNFLTNCFLKIDALQSQKRINIDYLQINSLSS